MTRICTKCNRTMAYDPYFGKYVCRQCGHTEKTSCVVSVKRRGQTRSTYILKNVCAIAK